MKALEFKQSTSLSVHRKYESLLVLVCSTPRPSTLICCSSIIHPKTNHYIYSFTNVDENWCFKRTPLALSLTWNAPLSRQGFSSCAGVPTSSSTSGQSTTKPSPSLTLQTSSRLFSPLPTVVSTQFSSFCSTRISAVECACLAGSWCHVWAIDNPATLQVTVCRPFTHDWKQTTPWWGRRKGKLLAEQK